MRVCGNPIFMLPITVYGRLLGKGGGVSYQNDGHNFFFQFVGIHEGPHTRKKKHGLFYTQLIYWSKKELVQRFSIPYNLTISNPYRQQVWSAVFVSTRSSSDGDTDLRTWLWIEHVKEVLNSIDKTKWPDTGKGVETLLCRMNLDRLQLNVKGQWRSEEGSSIRPASVDSLAFYSNNRVLLSKALSCDRLPRKFDIHTKY